MNPYWKINNYGGHANVVFQFPRVTEVPPARQQKLTRSNRKSVRQKLYVAGRGEVQTELAEKK